MSKTQLIYGFHALTSRLRHHPSSLRNLYVADSRQDARLRDFLELAREAGVHPRAVPAERLERMTGTRRHQGVVAEADPIDLGVDLDELVAREGDGLLLLALDGIQDPHNLGACLRVADGLGAHGVIAPKDRAAALSPTVAKVASGAAETLPYLTVTNLNRTLRELQDHGVWVVGTDDEAGDSLTAVPSQRPLVWVLGAEDQGLRRMTRETCDQLVRIPMLGTVESLNVSVAAGICLYETWRRRNAQAPIHDNILSPLDPSPPL